MFIWILWFARSVMVIENIVINVGVPDQMLICVDVIGLCRCVCLHCSEVSEWQGWRQRQSDVMEMSRLCGRTGKREWQRRHRLARGGDERGRHNAMWHTQMGWAVTMCNWSVDMRGLLDVDIMGLDFNSHWVLMSQYRVSCRMFFPWDSQKYLNNIYNILHHNFWMNGWCTLWIASISTCKSHDWIHSEFLLHMFGVITVDLLQTILWITL